MLYNTEAALKLIAAEIEGPSAAAEIRHKQQQAANGKQLVLSPGKGAGAGPEGVQSAGGAKELESEPGFKAAPAEVELEEGVGLVANRAAAAKSAYDENAKAEKARIDGLLSVWLQSAQCADMHALVAKPLTSALPDPSAMRAERPGALYAFRLLSRRRWYDLLRDKMKLRVQFTQYLFFAVVIGLIFLKMGRSQQDVQNMEGCCFLVCVQAMFMRSAPQPATHTHALHGTLVCSFIAYISSSEAHLRDRSRFAFARPSSFLSNLNTFGPEKIVMTREMESGLYSLPSYFFSRWIVEVPFRILFPLVYSSIVYWMIGFQATAGHFFLFAAALVLIDNCGTNLSICICSVFPDVQVAMQAGPAFVLPMMVFAGFYVKLNTIGWWFRWISCQTTNQHTSPPCTQQQ